MLLRLLKTFVSADRRRLRRRSAAGELLEPRQLLSAVTVQLSASQDTTLYAGEPDLSNGAGEYILAGSGHRGLLKFDLGGVDIPDGSTILDVVVTMNLASAGESAAGISLSPIHAAWGEAGSNASGDETVGAPARQFDATWLYASYDGQLWSNAGGDFGESSATINVTSAGAYEWYGGSLIDDVQGWIDDAATNFGWAITTGASMVKSFLSKDGPDAALAPSLEITFEEPPPPPALVQGRLWNDLNRDGLQVDPLLNDLRLKIVGGNTHYDGFGGQEHWFRSSVNNRWYFLQSGGQLTRWSGSAGQLTGQLVGTVDPKFHMQPGLVETSIGETEPWLNGWTVELLDGNQNVVQTTTTRSIDGNVDGAIDQLTEGGWYRFEVAGDASAYTVRQVIPEGWTEHVRLTFESSDGGQQGVGVLDLQMRNSYFEGVGGLGERWLYSEASGWYYITPDGRLFRWNGKPFNAENPLSGTLIDTPGPNFYADPSLLAGYSPGQNNSEDGPPRTDFGNYLRYSVQGRVWLDHFDDSIRNENLDAPGNVPHTNLSDTETWLYDSDRDAWFILDADRSPQFWGYSSDPDFEAAYPEFPNQFPVTREPWLNGRTVELLDDEGNVVATTVTASVDRNDDGTIQEESERGWYVFEDVMPGDYRIRTVVDDPWEQTAPFNPLQHLATELHQQFGFRTTARSFDNWGGLNERWLMDREQRWYYILPDGSLYRWQVGTGKTNGGLQGELIAGFSSAYHANLRLLTHPDVSLAEVSVGGGTATIDILFGNHRRPIELL
jgi:hypothetical protein